MLLSSRDKVATSYGEEAQIIWVNILSNIQVYIK